MGSGYDVAVIGGGIIGLATCYELLTRRPGLRLVVLEKEHDLARHQSGRNSGVLHAGLYYAPGSLKARMAVEGKRRLEDFAHRHDVPVERCGKLVIARDADEVPRLRELGRRADANGVEGIREIDRSGITRLEPHARGFLALHSPATAITDFREVALAIAEAARTLGGEIRTATEVVGVDERTDGVRISTTGGDLEAAQVVACAGLQSDRVAAMTGDGGDERIIPFRGNYLRVRGGDLLVRGNVYPVPDPRFPFLGVHLTRRVDGEVWAGPNALLSLGREGSANFRDLSETLTFGGFWRLAARHSAVGAGEIWRHLWRRSMLRELQRYVPDIQLDDLEPGPAGIRAQAVRRDGTMVDDFSFAGSRRVVHVRNAPSPGATAALAIGGEIADRILD
jgi:(S)-2-hydroxyglutarate dehydrogenase